MLRHIVRGHASQRSCVGTQREARPWHRARGQALAHSERSLCKARGQALAYSERPYVLFCYRTSFDIRVVMPSR